MPTLIIKRDLRNEFGGARLALRLLVRVRAVACTDCAVSSKCLARGGGDVFVQIFAKFQYIFFKADKAQSQHLYTHGCAAAAPLSEKSSFGSRHMRASSMPVTQRCVIESLGKLRRKGYLRGAFAAEWTRHCIPEEIDGISVTVILSFFHGCPEGRVGETSPETCQLHDKSAYRQYL